MKIGKAVLIGVTVVAVVVGVALWQVFANLDTIVANTIQKVGSEVLQTPVKVKSVKLKLTEGKASVSGLTIANPAGYSNPYIFTMNDIAVNIDVSSIRENPLVVEEILIREPNIFVEINSNGESNLDVLMKNIQASSSGDTKETEPQSSASEGGDELRFIIKKFRFEGGNLKATNQIQPDKKIDQAFPKVSMDNLGADSNGATAVEITTEMMQLIIAQATEAALKAGVNKAVEKEKEKLLEKAGDKLKGLFSN